MKKEAIIESIESLQIQDDFTDFVEYIASNKVKLTKTGRLGFKDCFNINQKLYHSIPTAHNRTSMDRFPAILFCFYVGMAAGIVKKQNEKSNVLVQVDVELFEYFQTFNKVEKYMALLSNFWINCQLDELTGEDRENSSVESIEALLTGSYVNNFELFTKRDYGFYLWKIAHIIRQFSFLGWIEYEDEIMEGMKSKFIKSLNFNELGKYFISTLCEQRPILYWNKYARLEESFLYAAPFFMMKEVRQDVSEEEVEQNLAKVGHEIFETPFQEEIGNVLDKLWKKETKETKEIEVVGNYIFKVLLTNKIWRRIAIASNATFEDLHLIIQKAFKFDNDHLYAFFPSGKLYKGISINSPWGGEAPFAHKIELNEFNVSPGADMVYLFDFGDCWEFSIVFEGIKNEKLLKEPKVIETIGKAPEQYPDWDEEEDDY